MARMIRLDADQPVRIDPQDKPVFICACGLTQKGPFCDGSHSAARKEQPGRLYVYDAERRNVIEERADCAS